MTFLVKKKKLELLQYLLFRLQDLIPKGKKGKSFKQILHLLHISPLMDALNMVKRYCEGAKLLQKKS